MSENFATRSTKLELMDDPSVSYQDFCDCLRDLESVNKLTLAYRPVKRWLSQISRLRAPLSIIDAGSGGGDTLRYIARFLSKARCAAQLTGVDLNPYARQYAVQNTESERHIVYETANIFDFEKNEKSDYIISSLFTHHLDRSQLIRFIQWMEQNSARGWFINDLHRHPIAFYGFRFLSKLLGFHFMIQNDGPISVARSFRRSDWEELINAAGIPLNEVTIQWYFPFRYCLIRHHE